MDGRPNILWISTHDINPDIACYAGVWPGAEYACTPNLDRLASEGARFDAAFAAAPVCAPARSAIVTGCFPASIGTHHMRSKAVPPPAVRLLPEYFRAAGYYCTNNSFTDFQVDVPPTAFDECGEHAHWRRRPSPATPFFAAFHGVVTHESQLSLEPEAFRRRTAHVADGVRHDPARAPLPPYYPDLPEFRDAWARYADLITEMDHWAGGLLGRLEEDGLVENTIVVFWSDHGKGLPRAKRWPNETGVRVPLLLRWPGRVEAGTTRAGVVQTLDLAPTMLAMAGLPVPAHMQGVALIDAEGRFRERPHAHVVASRDRMDEAEDCSRTVRDERFRYIRHLRPDRPAMVHTDYPDRLSPAWAALRRLSFEEAAQRARGEAPSLLSPLQRTVVAQSKPDEELYDVIADPHETRNLARDPRHRADLERLRGALAAWRETYGDLGDVPEEELVERWRPGGRRRSTPAPRVVAAAEGLTATSDLPGASIGWTTDPPGPPRPRTPGERITGRPEADGRYWRLYRGPVTLEEAVPVWFRAWRLGHEPSPEVTVTPEGPAQPFP